MLFYQKANNPFLSREFYSGEKKHIPTVTKRKNLSTIRMTTLQSTLRARHCAEHITFILLLDPDDNLAKQVLLVPFIGGEIKSEIQTPPPGSTTSSTALLGLEG